MVVIRNERDLNLNVNFKDCQLKIQVEFKLVCSEPTITFL